MAEKKQITLTEKEYVIPLRRACLKVPRHERSRIAIRTIKRFLAKHMKVSQRNLSNVRLDVHLNNDIWFRGKKSPPSKIKVRATKEGEIVRVDFLEVPEYVKFNKAKLEKRHKEPEKKPIIKPEEKSKTKEEEKPEHTKEEKKEEKEKEQSVAQQNIKELEKKVMAQKHTQKSKPPKIHRVALKK